jgi:hypothetical protein
MSSSLLCALRRHAAGIHASNPISVNTPSFYLL